MPDPRDPWEDLRPGAETDAGEEGQRVWQSFRRDSLVRLLDAALLMAQAAGNLARVSEEILAEQRDRLRDTSENVTSAADSSPVDSRSRIHLTY